MTLSAESTRDLTALAARLRRIVGDEHVVTHEHQLRTYESDGLLQYAVTPGLVVLPGSAEEVQGVVAACHADGVPFVARGAGSGLSGGAPPPPPRPPLAGPAAPPPGGRAPPCRSRTAC